MKRLLCIAALVSLAGCQSLQSTLDKEATAANLANVRKIAEVQTGYLDEDTTTPPTLIEARRLQLDSTVKLAEAMHEDASR